MERLYSYPTEVREAHNAMRISCTPIQARVPELVPTTYQGASTSVKAA